MLNVNKSAFYLIILFTNVSFHLTKQPFQLFTRTDFWWRPRRGKHGKVTSLVAWQFLFIDFSQVTYRLIRQHKTFQKTQSNSFPLLYLVWFAHQDDVVIFLKWIVGRKQLFSTRFVCFTILIAFHNQLIKYVRNFMTLKGSKWD